MFLSPWFIHYMGLAGNKCGFKYFSAQVFHDRHLKKSLCYIIKNVFYLSGFQLAILLSWPSNAVSFQCLVHFDFGRNMHAWGFGRTLLSVTAGRWFGMWDTQQTALPLFSFPLTSQCRFETCKKLQKAKIHLDKQQLN